MYRLIINKTKRNLLQIYSHQPGEYDGVRRKVPQQKKGMAVGVEGSYMHA